MGFQLTITAGLGEGKSFTFEQSETRIGRTSDNDVVLFDPGVSRKHARLFEENGRIFVEDSGSANGTKVNGTLIKGATALSTGDSITLGPVVFAFESLRPPDFSGNETRITGGLVGAETRIVNRQTVLPTDRKVTDAEMAAAVHQQTRGMSSKELKAELEKFRSDQAQAKNEAPTARNEARRPPDSSEAPTGKNVARDFSAIEDDEGPDDDQDSTSPRRSRALAKGGRAEVARSSASNGAERGLSAAERARLKRQAGDSLGGQIRYALSQMNPRTRLMVMAAAGVVLLGTLGGLYALFKPEAETKGPVGPEPDTLSMQVINASFGLGENVTWVRPDMKVFNFEFTTPTRAVVVLHYQAQDISEKEVALILNGIEQGFVPADVAGAPEREIEQVLQVSSLKRNEKNQLIFDNVKNPPGEEPWRIMGPWIEVVPVPELSTEETISSANEYAKKAQDYVERREVASQNLFLAWKNYRYAWIALESLEQKPDFYETVRFQMNALKKELDQLCGKLMLDAERSIQLKNRKKARQTLDDVPRYFPTNEHRCNNLARQKLNEYDL